MPCRNTISKSYWNWLHNCQLPICLNRSSYARGDHDMCRYLRVSTPATGEDDELNMDFNNSILLRIASLALDAFDGKSSMELGKPNERGSEILNERIAIYPRGH